MYSRFKSLHPTIDNITDEQIPIPIESAFLVVNGRLRQALAYRASLRYATFALLQGLPPLDPIQKASYSKSSIQKKFPIQKASYSKSSIQKKFHIQKILSFAYSKS